MSIAGMIRRAGHSVTLQRAVVTEDAIGGRINTFEPIAADISVWLQPASASVSATYEQRGITVTHRCYIASDIEAKEGDRLMWGSRYLVIEGIQNSAGLDRLWRLDVRELHNA